MRPQCHRVTRLTSWQDPLLAASAASGAASPRCMIVRQRERTAHTPSSSYIVSAATNRPWHASLSTHSPCSRPALTSSCPSRLLLLDLPLARLTPRRHLDMPHPVDISVVTDLPRVVKEFHELFATGEMDQLAETVFTAQAKLIPAGQQQTDTCSEGPRTVNKWSRVVPNALLTRSLLPLLPSVSSGLALPAILCFDAFGPVVLWLRVASHRQPQRYRRLLAVPPRCRRVDHQAAADQAMRPPRLTSSTRAARTPTSPRTGRRRSTGTTSACSTRRAAGTRLLTSRCRAT